jgi:hypothetical protein
MLTQEELSRIPRDKLAAALQLLCEFKARLAAGWLPQSAVDAMSAAVPDALIQEIVDDSKRGLAPRSMLGPQNEPIEDWRRTGFVEPSPLAPPPGVAQCDRLVDAQDERDRAQRRIDAAIRSKLR